MSTRLDGRVVEVRVADWEFECCLRPIVLGQFCRWWLTFCPGGEPVAHYVWTVRETTTGARLDGHGVVARWWCPRHPAPRSGTRPMSGVLSGTAHCAEPDGIPAVMGRVRRLRVISEQLRWETRDGGDVVAAVPGSVVLTDVARTPDRYDLSAGPGRSQTGVLIDLET